MPDAGNWIAAWAGVPYASMLAAAAVLLAGGLLGAFFFGGLWWTVQRGAVSPVPARWFLGSLVLRSAVVVVGFHVVGAAQPVRLGLCLLGFVVARWLVLRATRPGRSSSEPPVPPAGECYVSKQARHAPDA